MADLPKSPLAPDSAPDMPPVDGIRIGTAEAGIRYRARTDLMVIVADPGTSVAGVCTRNLCPGAPVDWSRAALLRDPGDAPRVVVVNSGTANVFTGQRGRDAVVDTARAAAARFGGEPEAVFLASTGVIGEPLEAGKVTAALPGMDLHSDAWAAGASAIMTTDTYPKLATRTVDGVTINGMAKGSGMIAPDMATMLAYVATDATVEQGELQAMLHELVEPTFNAITVDSDTSTSDTLMLLATNKRDVPDMPAFRAALEDLLLDLALQVVRDGEGATKYIRVEVTGATTDTSAKAVALSVANSPLVKTAVAGEDANWGRIVMAVGKAGEPAERDRLTVRIGPHVLAEHGELSDGYTEADGAAYMKGDEIVIGIDLGMGEGAFTAHTCDLTHGYISINADYRS